MPKKPGHDEGASCEGKVRHETLVAAQRHANNPARKFRFHGTPYKCAFCGFWHVGHRIGKRK